MKVYSIGREMGCDIIINDNSDVISRRHATLNVSPSGKMTIVDLSHNGTYVNGIRIAPNVPVPVTRKDNISFAHVARLDWNQIPNTSASIIRWGIIGVIALALVGGGVWGYLAWSGQAAPEESNEGIATVDSTEIKAEQEKKAEMEKQKEDSIKKQVQDSIDKVRKNTVVKPAVKKKDAEPKKEDVKKPEEPKKEEPKTNRQRG